MNKKQIKLIETKGDVQFYEDESGKLFQKLGSEPIEEVVNGDIVYRQIEKLDNYSIEYNLNGVYGYSIVSNSTGVRLEDRIWSLDNAISIAESFQEADDIAAEKEKMKALLDKAERLGWSVDNEDNNSFISFQKYSPAGQDCSFEIEKTEDICDFVKSISDYYENFDVSYETYLWLDNTGHGINGAPYDMKDVYEDMEWYEQQIKTLSEALETIIY